ncbi:hypothetical protein GLAREA_09443 [Glarea lozoyensis ATCC 20868]|uniref:Uncharacterized protein n=1 Tax=Glarea lozoyensis (strain ATCC 20868 / MF5171) TaxID=1116229 RepID=S3DPG3_GLAL2|nr:uncharacterized protein GLAREA_09443 [Glarea lozoyensis ATCC 20868]EPE28323.1 hypothetical protein GLAREA_09443 [Glarea lozoyensis ATCC 20868]
MNMLLVELKDEEKSWLGCWTKETKDAVRPLEVDVVIIEPNMTILNKVVTKLSQTRSKTWMDERYPARITLEDECLRYNSFDRSEEGKKREEKKKEWFEEPAVDDFS